MGKVLRLKVERVAVRACPNCGFLVSQTKIERSVLDFECNQCGKRKFSEFKIFQTSVPNFSNY